MWRINLCSPRSATLVAVLAVGLCACSLTLAHAQPSAKKAEPAPGRAGILEALATPTRADYVEMALSHVVDFLKDLHSINIKLDERQLENVGVDLNTPITMSLRGVTLESALNHMLRDLDLTWTISDEMLLITTPDEAAIIQETEVYDVSNLITAKEGATGADLAKLIACTIDRGSWANYGGRGIVRAVKIGDSNKLVVTHTLQMQRKVQELLSKLSASSEQQATSSRSQD